MKAESDIQTLRNLIYAKITKYDEVDGYSKFVVLREFSHLLECNRTLLESRIPNYKSLLRELQESYYKKEDMHNLNHKFLKALDKVL